MNEPRLLFPADHFQLNAAGTHNMFYQHVAIGRFPRGACGNGMYFLHTVVIRNVLEMQKSFLGLLDDSRLEVGFAENILSQPYWQANILERGYPPSLVYFTNPHSHGIGPHTN